MIRLGVDSLCTQMVSRSSLQIHQDHFPSLKKNQLNNKGNANFGGKTLFENLLWEGHTRLHYHRSANNERNVTRVAKIESFVHFLRKRPMPVRRVSTKQRASTPSYSVKCTIESRSGPPHSQRRYVRCDHLLI